MLNNVHFVNPGTTEWSECEMEKFSELWLGRDDETDAICIHPWVITNRTFIGAGMFLNITFTNQPNC